MNKKVFRIFHRFNLKMISLHVIHAGVKNEQKLFIVAMCKIKMKIIINEDRAFSQKTVNTLSGLP